MLGHGWAGGRRGTVPPKSQKQELDGSLSNKPGGSFLRGARILNDLQVVILRLPKEGFDKSKIVCLLQFHFTVL